MPKLLVFLMFCLPMVNLQAAGFKGGIVITDDINRGILLSYPEGFGLGLGFKECVENYSNPEKIKRFLGLKNKSINRPYFCDDHTDIFVLFEKFSSTVNRYLNARMTIYLNNDLYDPGKYPKIGTLFENNKIAAIFMVCKSKNNPNILKLEHLIFFSEAAGIAAMREVDKIAAVEGKDLYVLTNIYGVPFYGKFGFKSRTDSAFEDCNLYKSNADIIYELIGEYRDKSAKVLKGKKT